MSKAAAQKGGVDAGGDAHNVGGDATRGGDAHKQNGGSFDRVVASDVGGVSSQVKHMKDQTTKASEAAKKMQKDQKILEMKGQQKKRMEDAEAKMKEQQKKRMEDAARMKEQQKKRMEDAEAEEYRREAVEEDGRHPNDDEIDLVGDRLPDKVETCMMRSIRSNYCKRPRASEIMFDRTVWTKYVLSSLISSQVSKGLDAKTKMKEHLKDGRVKDEAGHVNFFTSDSSSWRAPVLLNSPLYNCLLEMKVGHVQIGPRANCSCLDPVFVVHEFAAPIWGGAELWFVSLIAEGLGRHVT